MTDNSSPSALGRVFVSIHSYAPQNTDELRLNVGDRVRVSKVAEGGWWRGVLLVGDENGCNSSDEGSEVGWFPSTYVADPDQFGEIPDASGTIIVSEATLPKGDRTNVARSRESLCDGILTGGNILDRHLGIRYELLSAERMSQTVKALVAAWYEREPQAVACKCSEAALFELFVSSF